MAKPLHRSLLPIPGLAWIITCLAVFAAGCQSSSTPGTWAGPQVATPVRTEPWQYGPMVGKTIITPHYIIHTTKTDDPDFIQRLAQTMEGAYEQYQDLCPTAEQSDRPMECWVFSKRPEWATFTVQHTGPDAKIYLQINRGGYTIHDWYVGYFTGDVNTYALAAHEGWHQYIGRNFKQHPPPFLEEGIATQFENIHWDEDLPRWNLRINANRAEQLRLACDHHALWPLDQLVKMHAGNVVGTDQEKIDAFYAQDWAFARFLLDADNGKFRPALLKLLADAKAGHLDDPTGISQHLLFYAWRPETAKPIIEKYLGMPLDQIEKEYLTYIHQIAYDRFNQQWQTG